MTEKRVIITKSLHAQASQIEARGIACARELMLIQTVDDGDTEGVFNAVDADGNARVDLRELALALSKWTLLVTRPESPLAAAKNLALDLFMIFGVDPLECAHYSPLFRCVHFFKDRQNPSWSYSFLRRWHMMMVSWHSMMEWLRPLEELPLL